MRNIKRICIAIVALAMSITLAAQDRVIKESFVITRDIVAFQDHGKFYTTEDGSSCTIRYEYDAYSENVAKIYLTSWNGEICWSKTFSSRVLTATLTEYDGCYHIILHDQNFIYFALVYSKKAGGYIVTLDITPTN